MSINKAIVAAALLTATTTVEAQNVNAKANIDPVTINHTGIRYWLNFNSPERYLNNPKLLEADVNRHIVNYQLSNQRLLVNKKSQWQSSPRLNERKGNLVSALASNTSVKVLAVLIDFPDLSHNAPGFSSDATDMYYNQYTKAHYQQMLFSTSGFEGPAGQSLQAVRQYYAKESGDSFDFNGEIVDWVRAEHNAKYYGENTDDASDKEVENLVIEAVTKAVANGTKLDQFDQDNNGVVDHLLIFHASIGEEAGGGLLGEDAIWSHSYSLVNINNGQPYPIPGSNIKVANYTIQPIDASPGVVAHEFGHDLGLDDEYDLKGAIYGAPVQYWSIMGSGTWVGEIRGSEPTGFSPLAREQLQASIGGNWINQQTVALQTLTQSPMNVSLAPATEHQQGTNQLKITLPPLTKEFKPPYAGEHLYYSGNDSNRSASLSFDINLPQSNALSLTMQAQWAIELDYDYVQLLVNGVAIANDFTKSASPKIPGITNFISSTSPKDQWQLLSYDLSAFTGQRVNVELRYVTDAAINEFGLVVDDITITSSGSQIFYDGAESDPLVTLNQFQKITKDLPQRPINYYIQYRSLIGVDSGLKRRRYEPGALLWLRDENFDNNNVSEHPGNGFIQVVDADQHLIGNQNTSVQLRDAAFGLQPQQHYQSDVHLEANPLFNDNLDYSSPDLPEAGVILPRFNFQVAVLAQTDTSIELALSQTPMALNASFNHEITGQAVTFTPTIRHGSAPYQYLWQFGDGATSTAPTPTHQYARIGRYDVSLTVTDAAGDAVESGQSVVVAPKLTAGHQIIDNGLNQEFSVSITAGVAPFELTLTFGDGHKVSELVPQLSTVSFAHEYQLSAEYSMQVSITDALGQTFISENKVSVKSDLAATFSTQINALTANFSANVTGGAGETMLTWDFGDGNTSSQPSPTYTYARAGTYTVSLTLTDESQLTLNVSQSVNVSQENAPAAKAGDSNSSGGSASFLLLLLSARFLWRWRNWDGIGELSSANFISAGKHR
mgnify:CR=1 FL=1